jgi:hypothetical protein
MFVHSLYCSTVFKRRVVVAVGAVDNLINENYPLKTKG